MSICSEFAEDAGSAWSSRFLRGELGTSAAIGGLGCSLFQVGCTAARFGADWLVEAIGRVGRPVERRDSAVGTAATVSFDAVPVALLGFLLLGVGSAALIPLAMRAADEIPGLAPSVGMGAASLIMRSGALCSPLLVGFLADGWGFQVALVPALVAGATAIVLTGTLRVPAVSRP